MAPFRLVPDDFVQVSKELLNYPALVAAREASLRLRLFHSCLLEQGESLPVISCYLV